MFLNLILYSPRTSKVQYRQALKRLIQIRGCISTKAPYHGKAFRLLFTFAGSYTIFIQAAQARLANKLRTYIHRGTNGDNFYSERWRNLALHFNKISNYVRGRNCKEIIQRATFSGQLVPNQHNVIKIKLLFNFSEVRN